MMTVVLSVGLGVLAGCLLLALLSYDGTVPAVETHIGHIPARVDSGDEPSLSEALLKDLMEASRRDDDEAAWRLIDEHFAP